MEGYRGSGAYLAVVAGVFATSGSLLGKLAGANDASSLVSWRQIRIVNKTTALIRAIYVRGIETIFGNNDEENIYIIARPFFSFFFAKLLIRIFDNISKTSDRKLRD